jgi:hypothetical protein
MSIRTYKISGAIITLAGESRETTMDAHAPRTKPNNKKENLERMVS